MKKIYFLIQGWDLASTSSRYRVLQYLPYLKELHIGTKVAAFPDSFGQWMKLFSEIRDYDTLFIQRKRLWYWQIWYLKRAGVKIIYDFDDAIMFKSPVSGGGRSFKRRRTFLRMIKNSNLVIVGNRYLESYVAPYNRNIMVIPTAIDLSLYTVKDYKKEKRKVTIGWIGSKSSVPYLKELIPAFDRLASHHKDIELKIICDDFFDCEKMPVIKKVWALEDENSDLQEVDIGLAPLPDHEWTKGKCATKLLQYLSIGVPVVCSPVGVHTEIIKEGVNGMFARSVDEWVEKLTVLINDKALRKRIGIEGRRTVESAYSLEANVPKFINAVKGI